MSLENVRKQLLRDINQRKQDLEKKGKLEVEAKKFVKMGNGYFKEKNFTLSFFSYYKAIKLMAMIYIEKKLGKIDLDEKAAVEFLVKREKFGLKKELIREFDTNLEISIGRRELTRADVKKALKICEEMKKETL